MKDDEFRAMYARAVERWRELGFTEEFILVWGRIPPSDEDRIVARIADEVVRRLKG